MIEISDDVSIHESELEIETSTSSGPGGQHANRAETRVTLRFDIDASPSLTGEQKARVKETLSSRVTRQGVLRVVAQEHRSQSHNRELALERFTTLLERALAPEAERKRTKKPRSAKRRRLEEKRRRSELKRLRRPPSPEE